MPHPVNVALYNRVRHMADKKFQAAPSLYKSAWMVHEYVKRGGKYAGKRDAHHGIVEAFSKQRKSRGMKKSRGKKSRSRGMKKSKKSMHKVRKSKSKSRSRSKKSKSKSKSRRM